MTEPATGEDSNASGDTGGFDPTQLTPLPFGRAVIPGIGIIRSVHGPSACVDQTRCTLHAPTPHRMRRWPIGWDAHRSALLRTCEHHVLHPDPDEQWFRSNVLSERYGHECDGCCRRFLGEGFTADDIGCLACITACVRAQQLGPRAWDDLADMVAGYTDPHLLTGLGDPLCAEYWGVVDDPHAPEGWTH